MWYFVPHIISALFFIFLKVDQPSYFFLLAGASHSKSSTVLLVAIFTASNFYFPFFAFLVPQTFHQIFFSVPVLTLHDLCFISCLSFSFFSSLSFTPFFFLSFLCFLPIFFRLYSLLFLLFSFPVLSAYLRICILFSFIRMLSSSVPWRKSLI